MDTLDIYIHSNDCTFLSFLINLSSVHSSIYRLCRNITIIDWSSDGDLSCISKPVKFTKDLSVAKWRGLIMCQCDQCSGLWSCGVRPDSWLQQGYGLLWFFRVNPSEFRLHPHCLQMTPSCNILSSMPKIRWYCSRISDELRRGKLSGTYMSFQCFHFDKCSCPLLRRNQKNNHDYTLQGQTLETVSAAKYLGVTIQSNLRSDRLINNTCAKANKMLGFMRQNNKKTQKLAHEKSRKQHAKQ